MYKLESKKKINFIDFIIFVVITFGIIVRVLCIDRFPVGLNCDEAAAGYEAYSILTTMHDRNGFLLPTYFLSWGSGQSVLLSYIAIPFVKIMGLNIFSIRLPMAFISSLSIIVFYKISKLLVLDNFERIIFVLFFTLNPWHIMKSRWGLDCNLLPDFLIFAVYFLLLYMNGEKKLGATKYLYISMILFSLSAYTYSTSYIGLFIFIILIAIYGLINKFFNMKQILISFTIILLIVWPLILFVIINIFDFDSIELIFLSIPKLTVNRLIGESVGEGFSIIKNFMNALKLFIFQNDSLYYNSIKSVGIYYIYGFPFFILGLIHIIKLKIGSVGEDKKDNNYVNDIFLFWFISGIILSLFLREININRINFIIVPMVYIIIVGIIFLYRCIIHFIKVVIKTSNTNISDDSMQKNNILESDELDKNVFTKIYTLVFKSIFIIIILISFSHFAYKYIDLNLKKEKGILIQNENTTEFETFAIGLKDPIEYADSLDAKQIRFYSVAREPFIYVLFYLKYDPLRFNATKKVFDRNKSFDNIKSFGKWNFENNTYKIDYEDIAYLINKKYKNEFDEKIYDIKEFGNFIVVNHK